MFCKLSVLFSFILFIVLPHHVKLKGPRWSKDNDLYDCVVAIYVHGKPGGIGTMIAKDFLVTSAHLNPRKNLKSYVMRERNAEEYFLYIIDGAWNKYKKLPIDQVSPNLRHRNEAPFWIRIGFDGKHSTNCDFLFLSLFIDMPNYANKRGRYPYFIGSRMQAADANRPLDAPYSPHGWKYAGFGYTDKHHITKSLELIVSEYPDQPILVDCDEWIPRPWGHFICLENVDGYLGIQAGAPLFMADRMVGMGAFELTKGSESILVFTDYTKYPIGKAKLIASKKDP